MSNNSVGIVLYSGNNTISSNTVTNNDQFGIGLSYSSNNTITNNTFVNDGISVGTSYQNTVENNTVNGKPLVYLENVSDYTITNAGQVILLSCDNITVKDQNLSNTSVGVELLETNNSKIINNNASNSYYGILLYSSSNNTLSNNTASNDIDGIQLYSSSNNTLSNNTVSNNDNGIHLYYSNNTAITNNTISNNYDGIHLYSSSINGITNNNAKNNDNGIRLWYSTNNKIYLNNFLNNTDNVHSYYSTNIWNSTEKITYVYNETTYGNYMGNYWDDYKEKYPDAKEIDGTGIWDTSYSIDSGRDYHPLMEPWENYFASYGVNLSCSNTQKSIPPGGTAEYVITVKNTGNRLDTINLTGCWPPPPCPCGWGCILFKDNITLQPGDGITLPPGDSIEVIAYIFAFGPCHSFGEVHTVTITGTSQGDTTKSDSVTTTTTIEQPSIFDTGPSKDPYPSIFGTHNGTITPNVTIEVSKLYTYPCTGTGGHTEYARIWNNSGLDVNASCNGYVGDWHNISFSEPFTLLPNETYNYTIRTGSYPQIIHAKKFNATGGTITCDKFIDANGRIYYDWIPAIRLE